MPRSTAVSPHESNGAPYNARWNNGVDSFIQKQSYGAKWLQSPNNLSQSVAGIKMSQPLPFLSGPFLSGWSIVGDVGMGIQSLLRVPRRRSAIASEPKRQGVAPAGRGRRLQPHRPARQLASVHRPQQPNIRHVDRRPRQHALARRDQLVRSDGRLLRLLTPRFLGLLRRLRRHRGGARQYCPQVPVDLPSNLFGLPGASFRLGGFWQWGGYDQGNGTERNVPGPGRRRLSTCSAARPGPARSRWTRLAAGPRTR